ncbi:hypothetical protein C5E11_04045 [Clavibacter michiganensis]|nr:helix-turn-helix transcriptional regulator [Clavibacter michiganensis]PPF64569.1 hypothetical protein C5E11_04045 [Clavibacter michiganensis]
MTNQNDADRNIGQSVRLAMADKAVSQYKLATHLGVSQPAVWRRLNGEVPFGYAQLASIAALLGITVEQLVATSALADSQTSSGTTPRVSDETIGSAAVPVGDAPEGDRVARSSGAIDLNDSE